MIAGRHCKAIKIVPFLLVGLLSLFFHHANSQPSSLDSAAMFALKQSLNPPKELGWSDPDPCKWSHVSCSRDNRVTAIQIGNQNLKGTLTPSLSNLTKLERFEVQGNTISGPLPTLSGLGALQAILLSDNQFDSIPSDFFAGMTSLESVYIDNNPFSAWEIPESLKSASILKNFSANKVNITGNIPTFIGPDVFGSLQNLHLAFNNLNGGLPSSFLGLQINSLWLNGQNLSGGIDVLQNMTQLKEVWLHSNGFSGPLPDFSGLIELETLNLRQNLLTGPVPPSLFNLDSLKVVNLTNNLLQGPVPQFKSGMAVDMVKDTNSFCLPQPGDCDPRVTTLLSIAKSVNYPQRFAENWKGNDPCSGWTGITCNSGGDITIINFANMGLTGAISPDIASLTSVQRIILSKNNLSGTIPDQLATLPALKELDVSYNNRLFGHVPKFNGVTVNTDGSPDIGKDHIPGGTPSPGGGGGPADSNKKPGGETGIWIGSVIGIVFLIGVAAFCWYRRKQKKSSKVHSPNRLVASSDSDNIKISVVGSNVSVLSDTHHVSHTGASDMHVVESGNMVISIQVLRAVTGNFSDENILGKGGFATVYKGEYADGTKIAVKRMESSFLSEKGLAEFKSEIAVLTKVRHRHLVALLGYCLDGNEKLIVFEYMPQGTLTRHLFNWASEGLTPLEWAKRLIIALDVARGVEYLHGLAQQSFIHRDLKPSNILLGDDMRAKVGDFGLVKLADGKGSIETKVAGTFGYLAPEYAVTGRVTTKVDVYSFGVILMELITGRKALDESQGEESVHLVTWFRRALINKDNNTFRKAIDPTIDLDEETFNSVSTVAELAGHCCAREPYQRPDMAHAVNVLSSLVEHWKPSDMNNNADDIFGIDLDMSLPQVLKKWQNQEDTTIGSVSSSSYIPSLDNTQTSIPARPRGFTDSFTSADGR